MNEIRIANVSKNFGAFKIIKNIDLEIKDGEFVVLVGPSGCGKSTLLRMIAGLDDITGGTISIGDVVVNRLPPQKRDVAMVFQNYALYPHYTVYDNMAFGLRLKSVPKSEISMRVRKAAETLGLTDLLDRYPKNLSGGQRQRVAMGRAIVRNPTLYLFDEPLSNLDAKLRISMRTEIKALHQSLKRTTVYVTHDQVEAMTMADRIVIMREGVIEQIGTPMDIYAHPANTFVAGFIGAPTMNFLGATVARSNNGRSQLAFDGDASLEVAGALPVDSRITVGVRPEHFRVTNGAAGLQGRVAVVEPTGPSDYLTVSLKSGTVTVVAPSGVATLGDEITLGADETNLHFFDEATGQKLGAQ